MADIARFFSKLADTKAIISRIGTEAAGIGSIIERVINSFRSQPAPAYNKAEWQEFQAELQETRDAAAGLQRSCNEALSAWNEFLQCFLHSSQQNFQPPQLVHTNKRKLSYTFERAAVCQTKYNEFKEKLQLAVTTANRLTENYSEGAEAEQSRAARTRKVGYTSTVLLGAVAIFAGLVTGGLGAAPILAGGAAVATGACTHRHASKLDARAMELDSRRSRLQAHVSELTRMEESINGLVQLTEELVRSVEETMRIFRVYEETRQQNQQLKAEHIQLKRFQEEIIRQCQDLEEDRRQWQREAVEIQRERDALQRELEQSRRLYQQQSDTLCALRRRRKKRCQIM